MIDALHISESGLRATQGWIDAISNNIANIQTPGFKKSSVQFSDLVRNTTLSDQNQGKSGATDQVNGIGTRLVGNRANFSLGSMQASHNAMDIAIRGNGFLEVSRQDGGPAYTRLGRLKINNTGQLMSATGLPLSEDIRIPPDVESIEITPEGFVQGRVSGNGEVLELGQIKLARIRNPEEMNSLGDGLYATTAASGEASLHQAGSDGLGQILQGHLEMSNVDLVEEMANLVMAQRAYQLNARIIQTADQVMETINNLRR